MRAILSAPGSRGDVNPMVAIGQCLKQRGHDVVISLAEPYAELAQRAGLRTESLIDRAGFEAMLAQREFWNPIRGARKIFRQVVAPFITEHHQVIQKHHLPGQTVLVSHPLDLASRVFRESDPTTPLVGVHLAPSMVRTHGDPARLTPWWFELSRPPSLLRAVYYLLDRFAVDPLITGPLEELRQQFSLPPVKRILDQWWLSPDCILAMYPDWYAPATRQYAPRLVHCGFPLRDLGGSDFEPPPDRPIVFTPGTAHHHCRKFFLRAVQACVRLDHPGLLVSTHAENFPEMLPSLVRTEPYVSFSSLLPHCAAIVHHGGIGTTSQALAAGIPQIVRPLAFDQFDNATKVERLGCGRWLRSDSRLQTTLREVLGSDETRARCTDIASRIDHDSVERAANQIERVMSSVLR